MANEVNPGVAAGCGILAAVGVFGALLFGGPWVGAWNSTDAGHVEIVRNGGWFGGNGIREIINPGHAATWTGFYTTVHSYPAQQRTYTISADPNQGDAPGVDVVETPSQDGVQIGVEGTVYYTLNLSPTVLKDFDNVYGTRSYVFNNKAYHAFDGDDGWNAFINTQVRPTLDSALRQVIATHVCAELNATCSLVHNTTVNAQTAAAAVKPTNVNYADVENAVNKTLARDINAQLGADPDKPSTWFITDIRFTLRKADIPSSVQDAANSALAALANVSAGQAAVQKAQLAAQAAQAQQQGYNACPTCQVIDELNALPKGLTTLVLGSGSPISIGTVKAQ